MTNDSNADPHRARQLLAPDEPAPFKVLNAESTHPVFLVCDHASRVIPATLGTMGLDPAAARCHLAWDIGAGALTEMLAERLNLTAVLCGYSRLVVDCNRQLLDPQAFLEFSDGVVVHGNRALSQDEKDRRAAEIYWPYHKAVDAQIKRLQGGGITPIILAIHSFTPVFNGVSRSWEMGILWDTDPRVPDVMIPALRKAGFKVGDNEPYSGRAPQDFTIDHHAEAACLPHSGIEVRQDLIARPDGVERVANVFDPVIRSLPDQIREQDTTAASA